VKIPYPIYNQWRVKFAEKRLKDPIKVRVIVNNQDLLFPETLIMREWDILCEDYLKDCAELLTEEVISWFLRNYKRQDASPYAPKTEEELKEEFYKKNPDKNWNRKPYIPVKDPWQNKGDRPLSPKFNENFQEYLNEQLLLEWPEGIIWSDSTKGIEIGWDWCSEETPEDGEWLQQLVMLFRYGALRTLRPDRNNIGNDDGFITQSATERIKLEDE
jgi:hypothetical protein